MKYFLRIILFAVLLFPTVGHAAYDPTRGVWLSRDPLEEEAGINLYKYVENNPINLIDPLGLQSMDTVTNSVMQAMARGSAEEIEAAIQAGGDAVGPELQAAARAAIQRLRSKASQVISKECKGSINEVFPSQMKEKTIEEINALAKGGDKAAQTARKLLTDKRFKK